MTYDQRARKVAERATEVWSQQGLSNDGYALGVVAALNLAGQADSSGPSPAKQLLAATDDEIAQVLSAIWTMFGAARPELVIRCGPLAGWINDDPWDQRTVKAVAAVTRAVVKAGLLDVTLNLEHARSVDMLGPVFTEMRSKSARGGRGEFYTPPNLCRMMAEMTIGDLQPGQSIMEPCAGTGGMFQAAAEVLRSRGKDPHDFWWFAGDISALAVAALAVNVHVWGLGPRVVLGVADTLAEPDWYVRAQDEQRQAIEAHNERMQLAATLAAFRRAEALITGADDAPAEPEPVPEPSRALLPAVSVPLVLPIPDEHVEREAKRSTPHRNGRGNAHSSGHRADRPATPPPAVTSPDTAAGPPGDAHSSRQHGRGGRPSPATAPATPDTLF